jgi:hypothetical protein
MTFKIRTHTDQPLAGTNENAHALRCLAADIDLSEPTRLSAIACNRLPSVHCPAMHEKRAN